MSDNCQHSDGFGHSGIEPYEDSDNDDIVMCPDCGKRWEANKK